MSLTSIFQDIADAIRSKTGKSESIYPVDMASEIEGISSGGYKLEKMPSGAVSSFNDGTDLPLNKLKVSIKPIQDLHGYDRPWVGGTGKNKLENKLTTQTINGVTATVKDDGTVIFTGTATQGTNFFLNADLNLQGSYTINGCPSGGGESTYYINARVNGAWGNKDYGNGVTVNNATITNIAITVDSGYAFPSGGLTFKPMIRLATVSDATFAPYSNICPISGWDEAVVTRCGKNLWSLGNISGTKQVDVDVNIPIGSWTFSCEITSADVDGTTSLIIFYYDDDTSSLTRLNRNTRVSYTFTATKHIKKISFYAGYNSSQSAGDTFAFANIQLELGATATTYEPYTGNTYTIDLDGTRYGGKLDVISGVLTVDRAYVELSQKWAWNKSSTYQGSFYADTSATLGYKIWTPIMCSHAKTINNIADYVYGGCLCEGSINFWLMDANATVQDWNDYIVAQKANGTPITICYELATPQTIQLTPTAVRSLIELNNIWADTGDIIEGEYFKGAESSGTQNTKVIEGTTTQQGFFNIETEVNNAE